MLIHYWNAANEDATKAAWVTDLKRLVTSQRIVFLRGDDSMRVNGLPILEGASALTLSARQ